MHVQIFALDDLRDAAIIGMGRRDARLQPAPCLRALNARPHIGPCLALAVLRASIPAVARIFAVQVEILVVASRPIDIRTRPAAEGWIWTSRRAVFAWRTIDDLLAAFAVRAEQYWRTHHIGELRALGSLPESIARGTAIRLRRDALLGGGRRRRRQGAGNQKSQTQAFEHSMFLHGHGHALERAVPSVDFGRKGWGRAPGFE